jgi:alpha-galactosidase
MNSRIKAVLALSALVLTGFALNAAAKDIPAQLPGPDGKPGDPTKPVKVYIMAGQSNMVGMGDITGARPPYPNMFLSADPAIIPGVMPIGPVDDGKAQCWVPVDRHGVFEAKAAVYPGPSETTKQPVKTVAVALGTVAENLPATEGTQTVVVTALMDVPVTGTYTVHAGFGDSTHSVVSLDGKEVYRKDIGGKPVITKVALETGKRYPVTITYFKGGSAAFWLEQVEIEGKGDLVTLTKKDKKFPYLLDDAGNWTARNDVFYKEARLHPESAGSPLSATSNNGASIGPELGFGSVMGTFHDEQVLLIKTAQGNRSLGFDFRPPSSGRTDAANEFEGLEYRLMVKGVRETLDKIDKVVPGYAGQGYEIAGFGWFQGHKDSGAPKEEYEKHLANLINDLRKEFKAPKMPAVVATVGFNGYRLGDGPWKGVWEAQMAVGDPKQHPEFAGTVASIDTRDFWREVDESPRGQDYHYNRNPETYLLVGEAMGRAMVRMLGGEAGEIPKSDREARAAARVAAEAAKAAKPAPTAEQKAASRAAMKPMILDGALAAYVSNPRYQPSLQAALKGEKPAKVSPYLGDALDEEADYYRAAGIQEYDWKPFGGDLKGAAWDYYGFDLPDPQAKKKGISDLKMTCPAGMENWFAPDFDTKKAGWKSGEAPFGVQGDEPPVPTPEWYKGSKRSEPKTACKSDVLLLRQNFELPPLKEGYRYRVRVGGSIHANSGEGYAIYVNGKLLAESKGGVVAWRREGSKPRGGHVWAGFRDEFKGGKVTIAVSNFPMNNRTDDRFIPARAPLSVWLEEMKIPPLGPEGTGK